MFRVRDRDRICCTEMKPLCTAFPGNPVTFFPVQASVMTMHLRGRHHTLDLLGELESDPVEDFFHDPGLARRGNLLFGFLFLKTA